jgi:hypothetical protein
MINEIAIKKRGPGNSGTWRQIGANHHITFVLIHHRRNRLNLVDMELSLSQHDTGWHRRL